MWHPAWWQSRLSGTPLFPYFDLPDHCHDCLGSLMTACMAMVSSPIHAKHLYYVAVEGSLNPAPISLHCIKKPGLGSADYQVCCPWIQDTTWTPKSSVHLSEGPNLPRLESPGLTTDPINKQITAAKIVWSLVLSGLCLSIEAVNKRTNYNVRHFCAEMLSVRKEIRSI